MPESIGMAVLIALFLLLLLRVPIGLAMILCALVGNAVFRGVTPALVQLQLVLWEMTSDFVLLTLPLFIWMGLLAKQAGLGDDLASCVRCWMGRLPGGLAATSALSSAGFGTLTGSSVATVLTMGGMMLPEMKRYGYQPAFAAGSIAAGGVLAILIPPSLPLIFYGAWTETSIAALFLAGIIPGLMLTLLFWRRSCGAACETPHGHPAWGDQLDRAMAGAGASASFAECPVSCTGIHLQRRRNTHRSGGGRCGGDPGHRHRPQTVDRVRYS